MAEAAHHRPPRRASGLRGCTASSSFIRGRFYWWRKPHLPDATPERAKFAPFPVETLNGTVGRLEPEVTRVGLRRCEFVPTLVAKPQRRAEGRDIDKKLLFC